MAAKTVKSSVAAPIISAATFKEGSYGEIVWVDHAAGAGKRRTDLDFMRNARNPWKRPPDRKELYEPAGFDVGAEIRFQHPHGYVVVGQIWAVGNLAHTVWAVNDLAVYLVRTDTLQTLEWRPF